MRFAMVLLVALAACGPQERTAPAETAHHELIADGTCAQIADAAPPEVYEDGWSIVTSDMLSESDRAIWNTYHFVECPGVAELDLDGDAIPEYAVALIQQRNGATFEKLNLLRGSRGGYRVETVWGPTEVANPRVTFISSVPNLEEGEPLQYDAFLLETIERDVDAFYLANGEVQSRQWSYGP